MMLRCISVVLLLAGLSATVSTAQQLQRSVVGNGAVHLSSGTSTMRGTVGQAAIGRVSSSSSRHNIGFWYRASNGGTIVAVPNREGEIGAETTVQILLTSSNGLVTYGPRDFLIKLRYNATVLVNRSSFPCERSGDDCILTITGTVTDSVGVLAEIPFLVTLGNAEQTDLTLDSIEWIGASNLVTDKRNGQFQALGVCKDGDTVRLIRRGPAAAITGVSPMPISSIATISTTLIEQGPTKMIIIDAIGREIATVLDESSAEPGTRSLLLDVHEIASGTYYLVLMTPSELFSHPISIRK